jgi:putative ABC transport system substrate-binding protein
MNRRELIAGLGGAAAWPLTARAQQPAMPVIGYLNASTPELNAGSVAALRRGLNQAGFIEGRNLTIEYRWAEGHLERRPALAADLVQRQVSVIVATGTVFAAFAKAATQTIPIVFIAGGDPVEFGLSASFNRPTGNLTGVHAFSAETATKRLQLLHEMVPSAETIAMLAGSSGQSGRDERFAARCRNFGGTPANPQLADPKRNRGGFYDCGQAAGRRTPNLRRHSLV